MAGFDPDAYIAEKKAAAAQPLVPGNIDLHKRPVVRNADGTISTVRSMSTNIDGREVLLPTVSDDGAILSDDDAIKLYRKTGKHLGMFGTPAEATAYAKRLHEDQAQEYGDKAGFDPDAYLASKRKTFKGDIAGELQRLSDSPAVGNSEGERERFAQTYGVDPNLPGVTPIANALAQLGINFGHGMFNTHLKISDLAAKHLGVGERVNPTLWQEQEQLHAPISRSFIGGIGDQLGTAALAVPVGIAGGAVASAALPAAAGAVGLPSIAGAAPAVAGGIDAAVANALMSAPGEEAEAAKTGTKWGVGIPLAIQALSYLPPAARAGARAFASLLMPGTSPAARTQALEAGAIRFGRTADDVAERLVALKQGAGSDLGSTVAQMEAAGGQGIPAGPLSEALVARGKELAPGMMSRAAENAYPRTAERILEKSVDSSALPSWPRLSLTQGQSISHALQEGIPYGKPGAKAAVNAQKDIARMFREAQEAAVAEAGRVNPDLRALADAYGPQKRRFGLFAEGAEAAEKASKPGLYGRLGDLMTLVEGARAGMAHHGAGGAALAVPAWALEHFGRTRGPAAAAATFQGLSNLVQGLSPGRFALRSSAPAAAASSRLSDLVQWPPRFLQSQAPVMAEAH